MSHTLRPALPLRPAAFTVIAFHLGFVLLLLLNLDRVPAAKPEFVPKIDFIPEPLPPKPDATKLPGPNLGTREPRVPPPQIPYDDPSPADAIATDQVEVSVPDYPTAPIVWTKAQVLERTEIPYPTVNSSKPEGTVRLRLRIGIDGRPIEVAVGTSSGYPALDRAALKAVAHWRFRPRLVDGNPVESWVEMPIVFRLRN